MLPEVSGFQHFIQHKLSILLIRRNDKPRGRIEFNCRNRNLPLLPQHHPMRELLLLHPLIIFLKLSVMPEAQQEARAIMYFNFHTLIRWELDVVMARLFMRRDRADKGDDPLVAPHPDINITRRAMQAIWIQQRIPPVLSGCSF